LSWFLQEQQCKNHAKPSLRSGADLKVKRNVGRTLARSIEKNLGLSRVSIEESNI